ncbi:MAG TPA: DegV family protein [Candidatus Dormibacteraeota bacterium]|nr:DegV family protein [Candidatus Dormibacteraeota bacterium]
MSIHRCAVVVDAASGLHEDAARGLHVVPMRIRMGDGEFVDDGIAEHYPDFYRRLRAGEVPATSTPAPGDYLDAYRRAQAERVLCLTIPARWSSMHDTAQLAADMLAAEEGNRRVEVMETPTAAAGFALVARYAASLCADGTDVDTVRDAVRSACDDVCMYGALATLTYVARSGRINAVLAGISNTLSIRPVFAVSGDETSRVALTRTLSGSVRALEKVAAEKVNGRAQWMLVFHADSPDEGRTLCERLEAVVQPARCDLVGLAPSSGAYTGPGAIGFALLPIDGVSAASRDGATPAP